MPADGAKGLDRELPRAYVEAQGCGMLEIRHRTRKIAPH
jgi:hypothetical protein